MRILLLILLGLGGSSLLHAERESQELSANWKFIKQDVALTASPSTWENVTIPHTWNAIDGQLGQLVSSATTSSASPDLSPAPEPGSEDKRPAKNRYYRGACWYERKLDIPAEWKGRRVFIRFEAASQVAKTYLNGHLLGEHDGAFTAFCYELTPYLNFGGSNELRVQVDNSRRDDIPPLTGDFNMDGGIYRPVHLISTDAVCVSPLDFASPGVYLTTKTLSPDAATVEVRSIISNGLASPASIDIETQIFDPQGQSVADQKDSVALIANETKPVIQTISLPHPHLWNGRKDPYVYTARIDVVRNGQPVDEVTQPLGLRTVAISQDKGFLLNGEPYPIYGVNRHQERRDKGWAISPADHDEDAQLILDMGATAVRLTHYPQSNYWHDLCDHNGLILWDELSLVGKINPTPQFAANSEQDLREMVLQLYNHPSICFWSLFNELQNKPPPSPAQVQVLQHMKDVVNELDHSRLIAAASNHKNLAYNLIPDAICFNCYPGWYDGKWPTTYSITNYDMTKLIDDHVKEVGKRIGVSEYGAGGNPLQHEEGPPEQPPAGTKGPFHPEEWQDHVHETNYAQMKNNPELWGTFVWAMFDFSSSGRHEGGTMALNDKGLVTQDRKIKKDAYFFYQANWSTQPMVYIASRRSTPRVQAVTEVRVYSNCAEVELKLNGQSLGTVRPDSVNVFRWDNVELKAGTNVLEASGHSEQANPTDSCQWVLQSPNSN